MFNFKFFFQSFKYAFKGLKKALQKEQSFRIQVLVAFLVLILGFYVRLNRIEFVIILAMITLVLSLELINTTAEKIIDVVNPKKHPKIRFIKDVMAGSVLMAVFGAMLIGLIIFLPHIF